MGKKLIHAAVQEPPNETDDEEEHGGGGGGGVYTTGGTYSGGGGKRNSPTMKRVSFYVPEPLYEDLVAFAEERGDTITGVVRWSLGIGKAIWDEVKNGHRISSEPPQGRDRELIFGRY